MSKLFHFILHQKMDAIVMFNNPLFFQALASALLLWFITKCFHKPSRTKNLPPSPPKLPVLGNLHQLSSLPHHNLQRLSKKHGPLMLLHFGSVPTLIVSSAEGAREIMKTHDLNFTDRPESSITKRLLYNYKDVSVAPYGEYWRQLKSICMLQLLSNKRVQSFHSIREEETSLLIKKIREYSSSSRPLNLSEMFIEITNDVVSRSAFGQKYGEGEEGKRFVSLLGEFLKLLGTINIGDFVPWLSWIMRVNGFDASVDKVARELDEFLEHVIEERTRRIPKDWDEEEEQNKDGQNFLDILLDIYQNNPSGVTIDRDSVKAILLDVFAAGTDTTSTVLEWAMTQLLRHHKVMKKLQDEIREKTKAKHEITNSDLENMPYLRAVIKETLRLHTPIPMLVARIARNDVKIMGYDIPAKTMVMINAWAISRDPNTWDEPEKFNPDRFLYSSIDFKGQDFELIPFGAGRRGCPGISFAMATNEFVLANLVKKFDWKLAEEGKELDMSEVPGIAIRRAVPLLAVAFESVENM